MARIVFISPYLKGGENAAHLAYRTRYFATRDGVELLPHENGALPVTKKQEDLINRLIRNFPSAKEMLEYADYQSAPNRQHASEFISQAWEQFIEPLDQRENYLDYVAHRPGVQSLGEHGLWNADGKVPVLSQAIHEVAHHTGNVWTPVVSLPREHAERLGYADAENWRALVNSCLCDIAKGYKIHPDNLRWYAAFHEKEKHVHIHMILFSTNPKEGFLTRQGIWDIKSAFAKQIFRQDLISVYEKQTQYRDTLGRSAESVMAELIARMESGTIHSDKLELLTANLAERLRHTSGRKVYGYLPPRVKAIVDEIVDELAGDERVAAAYDLWQEMRDEVCRTYSQNLPERLPLSRQKEFKPVRNMVIREALKLSEMTFAFDDEGMEDDTEQEEVTVADESAKQSSTVFQQADCYRRAKKTLTNESANAVEKTAAFDSLRRLWDEGYTIAAHQLGKLYRDGIFVLPNIEEAAIWFQCSAEAGNNCSAYALGKLLLEQGKIEGALHWLERAAQQNDQYAQYRLGKVYLTDEVVPKNIDTALKHLTSAAKQGNQYAQYTLGKLFLLGQDVEQDREAAIRWLTLSAAQGNTYAQYFLDHKEDFHGASVGSAVLRMLHHMGQIFRENTAAGDAYGGMQIDKKRRKKLREKKMAMGHKPDDHENAPTQTMR